MQIIDLSQVVYANLMMQMSMGKGKSDTEIDEEFLRHMVLNTIRSNYSKFKSKFGTELIIASDDKRYWRKKFFPYYKALREEGRAQTGFDWALIYSAMEKIKAELDEYFPYCLVQVEEAEADDIIGAICHHYGQYMNVDPILIISADKDFRQLHMYANVSQWDQIRKKQVVENDPEGYLQEHILRGDKGDGVPNFLSPDDCIVTKTRQKPLMSGKLEVWKKQDPKEFCDEEMLRRYERNKLMVDLSMTPQHIKDKIIEKVQHYRDNPKSRSKLFNYFVKYRLKNLLDKIGDF